ncbi:hypothetical protein [Longitalea arenae]|uniref:hypothetical protein n=1 Tax=Longitalea arenae TaxID=2812558 RepID=UPI00196846FC|nr:hypothetical protein [Longitalea arenae]
MKEDVQQVIQQRFRQNAKLFPESYPKESGRYTDEARKNAAITAESFWDMRIIDDIERDSQAGVTKEDYINWCTTELLSLQMERQ